MKKLLIILSCIIIFSNSCRTRPPLASTEQSEKISKDITPSGRGSVDKPDGIVPPLPEAPPAKDLKTGMTKFSMKIFQQLSRKDPEQNISFSPVSLNMAMAMVYAGARGSTLEQMSRIMNFDSEVEVFHQHYVEFFKYMMEMSRDTTLEFNLANKVFLEQTYKIRNDYRENIELYHGGAFEQTDFINNYKQTESHINKWVEQMTRDRIRDLIPTGTLDDLTRLVLVNAIYIKSAWKYPFDETFDKDFKTINGNLSPKKFMRQVKEGVRFAALENLSILELPYTSPNLSLLLILPDDLKNGTISDFIPDQTLYEQYISRLRLDYVHMEIPRFKVETTFALAEELKKMGMDIPFSERADFSGMSSEGGLAISEVLQKVFFEVDEKGSEAAAATAVVIMATSSAMDREIRMPVRFIADKPFIFILKENKYNTPLFIGQFVK